MNARTALTLIAAAATATGSFAQGPTLPPGLAPPSPPSATQQGNSATAAPKDACSNCATITTIQMTTERQDWTPLGTVAPGSVGIAGAGVSEGRTAYVIGSDLSNKGLVMLGAAGGAAYWRSLAVSTPRAFAASGRGRSARLLRRRDGPSSSTRRASTTATGRASRSSST